MRKAATVLNCLVLAWTARHGLELPGLGVAASVGADFVLVVGFAYPLAAGALRVWASRQG